MSVTGQMANTFEIRVKGRLSAGWSEWFEGLTIADLPNGETRIAGPVQDQAALFGALLKIRDLGLILVSVNRVGTGEA
jgi:hypothetical protein